MIFDTSEEIDNYIAGHLSCMPLDARVMQFINLNISARAMVLAGIKSRYPRADKVELRKRLAAILLGDEFVRKQYNWNPEIEGY